MKTLFLFVTICAPLCTSASKNHWKIDVAEQPSIVTGSPKVILSTKAVKANTVIVLGCNGGTPMFRIAEDFKVANGIDRALTKSEVQRQLQTGPQYETFGFDFKVVQGDLYQTNVAFRLEGQANYLDGQVSVGWKEGTYFLILDQFISQVVPKMTDSGSFYVTVPYKDGPKDRTFILNGISAALATARMNGCRLQ